MQKEERQVIGRRFRARREELGMSLEEVGYKGKCSVRTVSGLEAGESIGTLEVVMRIAEVMNVSLNWLVWGQEPKALREPEETLRELKALERTLELRPPSETTPDTTTLDAPVEYGDSDV